MRRSANASPIGVSWAARAHDVELASFLRGMGPIRGEVIAPRGFLHPFQGGRDARMAKCRELRLDAEAPPVSPGRAEVPRDQASGRGARVLGSEYRDDPCEILRESAGKQDLDGMVEQILLGLVATVDRARRQTRSPGDPRRSGSLQTHAARRWPPPRRRAHRRPDHSFRRAPIARCR